MTPEKPDNLTSKPNILVQGQAKPVLRKDKRGTRMREEEKLSEQSRGRNWNLGF